MTLFMVLKSFLNDLVANWNNLIHTIRIVNIYHNDSTIFQCQLACYRIAIFVCGVGLPFRDTLSGPVIKEKLFISVIRYDVGIAIIGHIMMHHSGKNTRCQICCIFVK